MPKDSFEFRIGFRKLLIGFLVTLVPVNLAAIYAVSESATSMDVFRRHEDRAAQVRAARQNGFLLWDFGIPGEHEAHVPVRKSDHDRRVVRIAFVLDELVVRPQHLDSDRRIE